MKKTKLDKLTSTQRLPRMGNIEAYRHILCLCQKKIGIPNDLKLGHVKCFSCSKIHKVGIPPQYIRIECKCGKVLTALKKHAGKKGRCPGCKNIWKVPLNSLKPPQRLYHLKCSCKKILTFTEKQRDKKGKCPGCKKIFQINQELSTPKQVDSDSGPVHFKCSCGQPHMVEAQKAQEKIRCFRCNQEVIPHKQLQQESKDTAPQQKTTSIPVEEPTKIEIISDSGWQLTNPYPEENPFAILQVSVESSIEEIKKACRTFQMQAQGRGQEFQKVQLAKDTLCRPFHRLWYEILRSDLQQLWVNSGKKKWLKFHDTTIKLHHQAMDFERQMIYHKADKNWQKATKNWITLLKTEEFWKTVKKRGEELFTTKFKDKVLQKLQQKLLPDVVVFIGKQFYERYLGESHLGRAEYHLELLLPTLRFLLERDPTNEEAKSLLIVHNKNKAEEWVLLRKWDKAMVLLDELVDIAGEKVAVKRFAAKQYIAVYDGQGQKNQSLLDKAHRLQDKNK